MAESEVAVTSHYVNYVAFSPCTFVVSLYARYCVFYGGIHVIVLSARLMRSLIISTWPVPPGRNIAPRSV